MLKVGGSFITILIGAAAERKIQVEIDNLSFEYRGITYLLYRTYFSENESSGVGILVKQKSKKNIRIVGRVKSVEGCICSLNDTDKIQNDSYGLEF